MKTITLTQGQVALVDDADFESVNQFKWYALRVGRRFYATRNTLKSEGSRGSIYLHRFLMPGVAEIDHIDGNSLDNQRANLRSVSHRQNKQAFRHKAKGKTSRFRGVSWYRDAQKWSAQIYFNGKKIHLGYLQSEQDAALAYDVAAKQYFGEFASPNFP